MFTHHLFPVLARFKPVLWGTVILAIIMLAAGSAVAANRVDVGLRTDSSDDTIRVCLPSEFEIWIENDVNLTGMSLGFEIWTQDAEGLIWEWQDVGGYGASGCVRDVPGSRLYPADSIFNLTGFRADEYNMDGRSADTIMVGGVAYGTHLQPGPLQKMVTMAFKARSAIDATVRMLCIDSAFVPPNGPFLFIDAGATGYTPLVTWPEGGICWPVAWGRCGTPPEWDPGLPTSMIAPYTSSGTVTLSAHNTTPPFPDTIIMFGNLEVKGGGGEAALIDHGDGTCDVSYTPIQDDIGKPISIQVDAGNVQAEGGCWNLGCTFAHIISVTVPETPLGLDCGFAYLNGATNNPMTKSDISPLYPEYYGELTYAVASGPGEINPVTGVYTWTPGPADIGQFPVELSVSGNGSSAECSFTADVLDENCCPGDANYDGTANVGDAVLLINFVFKGGRPPTIMNWGDVNADCNVNVGDAVYLVNFVFRYGPSPLVGCVY